MQQYKINNYEAEYERPFPEYKPLDRIECSRIINKLFNSLPKTDASLGLFPRLESILDSEVFDQDVIFDIAYIFSVYDFADEEDVYLIWNVDEVDVMTKFSLLNIWERIWNPDEDEAVILYSPTNGKMLMITNWGTVYNN